MSSYFDEHDCTPLADGAAPNELLHFARFLVDSGNWDHEAFSGLFADRPPPPASKEFVQNLPSETLDAPPPKEIQCPICLKVLDKGDCLLSLPCSHDFHSDCVKVWLRKAANCPLCRLELPTDDEEWEEMKRQKKRKEQREKDLEALHDSFVYYVVTAAKKLSQYHVVDVSRSHYGLKQILAVQVCLLKPSNGYISSMESVIRGPVDGQPREIFRLPIFQRSDGAVIKLGYIVRWKENLFLVKDILVSDHNADQVVLNLCCVTVGEEASKMVTVNNEPVEVEIDDVEPVPTKRVSLVMARDSLSKVADEAMKRPKAIKRLVRKHQISASLRRSVQQFLRGHAVTITKSLGFLDWEIDPGVLGLNVSTDWSLDYRIQNYTYEQCNLDALLGRGWDFVISTKHPPSYRIITSLDLTIDLNQELILEAKATSLSGILPANYRARSVDLLPNIIATEMGKEAIDDDWQQQQLVGVEGLAELVLDDGQEIEATENDDKSSALKNEDVVDAGVRRLRIPFDNLDVSSMTEDDGRVPNYRIVILPQVETGSGDTSNDDSEYQDSEHEEDERQNEDVLSADLGYPNTETPSASQNNPSRDVSITEELVGVDTSNSANKSSPSDDYDEGIDLNKGEDIEQRSIISSPLSPELQEDTFAASTPSRKENDRRDEANSGIGILFKEPHIPPEPLAIYFPSSKPGPPISPSEILPSLPSSSHTKVAAYIQSLPETKQNESNSDKSLNSTVKQSDENQNYSTKHAINMPKKVEGRSLTRSVDEGTEEEANMSVGSSRSHASRHSELSSLTGRFGAGTIYSGVHLASGSACPFPEEWQFNTIPEITEDDEDID